MVCRVDLDKCLAYNLTPTQFVFLNCLHIGQEFPWPVPQTQVAELEANGWIKITPEGPVLREKFLIFVSTTSVSTDQVSGWIDEWRTLWPAGVKSGGRPVRGDKKGCLLKMAKFVKEYDYSKEEIFEATRIYVFEKSRENNRYMTCADYFIIKNGASTLASFCEDIRERGSSLKEIEDGTSSFVKNI